MIFWANMYETYTSSSATGSDPHLADPSIRLSSSGRQFKRFLRKLLSGDFEDQQGKQHLGSCKMIQQEHLY